MTASPIFVGSWRNECTAFIAAHGTNLALPCWVAPATPSRIHAISVANTDGGANTILLYHAKQMTLQSNMTVGAFVDGGGGSDSITRTAGSFITDGWKIGDRILVADPTTLANAFFATLTAVVALTLTFATSTVDTAENLPSGAIIYRLCQLHLTTLAVNAGNAAATDALDLLTADFPAVDVTPDRYLTIEAGDALVVSLGTAVGASPDRVDVFMAGGDY